MGLTRCYKTEVFFTFITNNAWSYKHGAYSWAMLCQYRDIVKAATYVGA